MRRYEPPLVLWKPDLYQLASTNLGAVQFACRAQLILKSVNKIVLTSSGDSELTSQQ